MKIRADPGAKMAVLTEGLIMAIDTVIWVLLGRYPMLAIPNAQVGRRDTFFVVAFAAFFDRHVLVFIVRLHGRH
jgi:hypothetical protein